MRLQKKSREREIRAVNHPFELNRFRMLVPETGYKWLEDADTDSPFTDKEKLGEPPYLVLNDAGPEEIFGRSYFPLRDVPDLFCRFRDVGLDPEAILAFANQYGSIGDTSRVIGRGGSPLISAVGISRWHDEIQAMVIVDHLWRCIQADDRQSLRRYLKWHPTEFEVTLTIGIQGKQILTKDDPLFQKKPFEPLVLPARHETTALIGPRRQDPLRALRWGHADVLGPARLALMDKVNPRLQEYCHPRIYLDKDRGFAGHLTPNNLLGCIWLQFYLSIISQLKLRRCIVCGFGMDVTASRSTKKMHDHCSKNRRMRAWRRKRSWTEPPAEFTPEVASETSKNK